MKTILKPAALFACFTVGTAILFSFTGGWRFVYDVVATTWYGALGGILNWPGMVIAEYFFGSTVGWIPVTAASLLVWFMMWSLVWGVPGEL
jgi:hypothetical protein